MASMSTSKVLRVLDWLWKGGIRMAFGRTYAS